jgi:branched-chain amino acid transport system substrate-binding protein
MTMGRRWSRALGALCGIALVAAGCGGDGDATGQKTAEKIDEGVKSEVATQLKSPATATTAPPEQPTTMEGWLALWEKERAATVKRIKDNKWGKSADGASVSGPEGFTIDLTKCAPGWSDTEGLTDYGNIARAMDVVWNYVNAQGGIKDSAGKTRKITMITKDDGYDSARTIPLVDELIDSERVFAMWTLGSPNTLKTYAKLNERCIPQPFSMTGHPAWGDPVNHPWTTGMALAYTTEAILWGSYIEQNWDSLVGPNGKVTVGALVMNNDFGKAYDVGFKGFLASSPKGKDIEYFPETIEPAAPTIKDPMTTISAKDPEVFIAMTAGTSCTQTITEAAENGLKESAKLLFTGQPCKTLSWVGKEKVGGDGSASDGWKIAGGGNLDGNSPSMDGNAWFVWARQKLAEAGYDYKASGSFLQGFLYAWPFWQSVQIAAALDGGLTRTNLVLAMRSMDMTNPNLISGIRFNMNGNADAYPIEGSEFARFDFTKQAWIQEGEIVELSGKSANCSWDQAIGNCR